MSKLGDRTTYIGASDISAIIGVNPWTTPYDCWLIKTGKKKEPQENSAMKRGKNLESEARKAFIAETGIAVTNEVIFTYKDWDIAKCHPDGRGYLEDVIVEIKCPMRIETLDVWKQKEIPKYYYCQCQWQMLCSNGEIEVCHFFGYHPDGKTYHEIVKYDKDYAMNCLKEAKDFWKLVQEDIPPAVEEQEAVFIEDEAFYEYEKLYLEKDREEKEAKEAKQQLRQYLEEFTDGSNCYGKHLRLSRPKPIIKTNWEKLARTNFDITEEMLNSFTEIKDYSNYRITPLKKS